MMHLQAFSVLIVAFLAKLASGDDEICSQEGDLFILNQSTSNYGSIEACRRHGGVPLQLNDKNLNQAISVGLQCQFFSEFWVRTCQGSACPPMSNGCPCLYPWKEGAKVQWDLCQWWRRPICQRKKAMEVGNNEKETVVIGRTEVEVDRDEKEVSVDHTKKEAVEADSNKVVEDAGQKGTGTGHPNGPTWAGRNSKASTGCRWT